jgi:uracil-DNA glycosylase
MNKPKATLGNLVEHWQSRWPDTVVLPHPSPRNTYWINQRPWIEDTIVPAVQERVAQLLGSTIG